MKWRFLLFILVVACVPAILVVLTTGDVALSAEGRLEERLTGALSAYTARFEAEGARRRELLLRLSALESLTQPVRDAGKDGTAPAAAAAAKLRVAVMDLYPRDVPELLAIATAQGAQVVQTAGEPKPVATADLPLAGSTLRDGQIGETLASYDGALYRFSSAPLGVAEGAIIIGDRIGENTVNRWRDGAKAQHVTLVSGGQSIVSTLPEELRAEIALSAEQPSQTLLTGQIGTGVPGLSFLDPYFPVLVPGAKYRSTAHALPGGFSVVVTIGAYRDLLWLGRMQLFGFAFALALLVVGLLWLPVIYGPVTRQARSIEAHLARLRVERALKLTKKGFTKPFASLAEEVDRLSEDFLKNAASAPPKERTPQPPSTEPIKPIQRPIDLPLAPSPQAEPDAAEGTPSSFPFGDAPLKATGTAGAALGQDDKTPVPGPSPAALRPAPKPSGRSTSTESLDPPVDRAEPTGPIPLPGSFPTPAKGTGKDPFASFGPATPPEPGDRTREAMVPEELLARSRELEQELLESPADPDEDHFREVFEEFVAARKKCGEPPDGLTLDKFTARLKKNREQLVEKYKCRTVRFQVYVKDGKAAVKAAPVR